MNPLYELNRYTFVFNRDGKVAADVFARQCIRAYLASVKDKRRRRGRGFEGRQGLIEGAYSFRYILRRPYPV